MKIDDYSPVDLDSALGLFVAMINELNFLPRGSTLGRRAFEVFSGAFFESYDVRLKGMIEIYLAFEEGELVGISLLHHLLDVSSAEFIVYVKPSQRKKGIGFSLVQNIVDRAGETGLTDLFSFVAPGARTSKSVLEKAGFKAQELKMVRTLLTTQSNIHTNETSE